MLSRFNVSILLAIVTRADSDSASSANAAIPVDNEYFFKDNLNYNDDVSITGDLTQPVPNHSTKCLATGSEPVPFSS